MALPDHISSSLIELKPRPILQTRCPYCNCMDLLEDWIWQGVHFIGIYKCFCCERKFHLTLPTGHAKEFPVAMDENFKVLTYPQAAKDWLADPLINALNKPRPGYHEFERQVRRKREEVIIVNCLDTCYGHVLYKLFYSQRYLEQDEFGLLYLVPENVVWMVPERADELLVVKGNLAELNTFDPELHDYLHQAANSYQKILLSESLPEADEKLFEPKYFFPAATFKTEKFKQYKQVLFVLREDRPWVSNRLDYILYLASRKWPRLTFLNRYLVNKQKILIRKLIQCLKRTNPTLVFKLAGLISRGSEYPGSDQSLFNQYLDQQQEEQWLKEYRLSDLVIGVHGSHLLLPSIFAKNILVMVPPHKIEFAGQDVFTGDPEKVKTLLGLPTLAEVEEEVKLIINRI